MDRMCAKTAPSVRDQYQKIQKGFSAGIVLKAITNMSLVRMGASLVLTASTKMSIVSLRARNAQKVIIKVIYMVLPVVIIIIIVQHVDEGLTMTIWGGVKNLPNLTV